jgi:threonine/homoserine/homoserine lactone efflux protein
MDFSFFIQGIIIGLTLAAPVGPIALICIQRTLTDGRFHGIFSGIGVATADSFYAAVTVLGLTIISSVIVTNQFLFRFLAGIVLIFVGVRVFMSLPSCINTKTVHETYFKDYLSMVGIAIANPLTLVFFLIVLPGFGIVINSTAFPAAAEFVAGVFLGSTVWWIFLCGTIGSMRSRFSEKTLGWINRVSGVLISVCGAGMLVLLAMTI